MEQKINILSIDDSRSVHAFLNNCLEGMNIIHAYNGEEGLKIINDGKSEINLILLDWEMPGISGPEVLGRIVEKQNHPPVIMLTSKNNPDEMIQLLDKGAAEYVLKPFTKELIREKILFVIGR